MEPEVIDLGSLDIGDGGNGGRRSSNFGGGLELLMNDRFKSGGIRMRQQIYTWTTLQV